MFFFIRAVLYETSWILYSNEFTSCLTTVIWHIIKEALLKQHDSPHNGSLLGGVLKVFGKFRVGGASDDVKRMHRKKSNRGARPLG